MGVWRAASLALVAASFGCEDTDLGGTPGDGSFIPQSISFQIVPVGERREVEATLQNLTADGVTVQELRFDPPRDVFSVRRKDGGTLRGSFIPRGGKVDFTVLFVPRAVGDYGTQMVADLGDARPALPMSAEARDLAPVDPEVSPASLTFTSVPVGSFRAQPFRVTNRGEASGRLEQVLYRTRGSLSPYAVTLPGGAPLTGDPELASGESLDLELRFSPIAEGSFDELIELDFGRASAELSASGNGVRPGMLSCEPEDLAFGEHPRGASVTRSVTCTSTAGEYRLERLRLTSGTSSLFSLVNPPSALDVNGRIQVQVRFSAAGIAARHMGAVEFVAAHGAVTQVLLSGAVNPPPPELIDLSVELQWSTDQTDFDVHLVRAGGSPFDTVGDCHFRAKNPDWGVTNDSNDDPYLDRDTIAGFGPEEINLLVAREASYDVYVHYYNYLGATPPATTAYLRYILRGGMPVVVQRGMTTCGSVWHVGRFDFGGTPGFTAVDTVSDAWRSLAAARCQ